MNLVFWSAEVFALSWILTHWGKRKGGIGEIWRINWPKYSTSGQIQGRDSGHSWTLFGRLAGAPTAALLSSPSCVYSTLGDNCLGGCCTALCQPLLVWVYWNNYELADIFSAILSDPSYKTRYHTAEMQSLTQNVFFLYFILWFIQFTLFRNHPCWMEHTLVLVGRDDDADC